MSVTGLVRRGAPARGSIIGLGLAVLLVLALFVNVRPAAAANPCGPPVVSVIACENSLPGDPPSDWQVKGAGDPTIQGFATSTSVNVGQTEYFKINTPSKSYHIDILRVGHYQGDGARLVAEGILPTATLPQSQPACKKDHASGGLTDCSNWAVSAAWSMPPNAVPGLYLAHLKRDDTTKGNGSLIPFVVRNPASHDTTPPTSKITSPATGDTVYHGSAVTIKGTARDARGVAVAGVVISTDGGATWHPVTKMSAGSKSVTWSYSWIAHGSHATRIETRAVDDSGNLEKPGPRVTVNVSSPPKAAADTVGPDQTGQWGSLMNWPTVAMHGEMLPDGNILTWGDSGEGFSDTAVVWDPTTNILTSKPDPFANPACGGNNALPDGRIITVGGGGIDPADANTNVTGFNETNQAWTKLASNAFPTWYASTTVLANGNLLRLGGVDGCNNCNPEVPEEFSPSTNQWTTLSNNPRLLPMYPFTYVRPDGTVAVTGASQVPEPLMIYNPATQTWTTSDPNVVDGGSSAMYDTGLVIKAGSDYGPNAAASPGTPSANTAYITDLNQATPTWTQTGSMAYPRSYLNLTPLPDGTVLASGGGTTTDSTNLSDGVLPAEDWDPATGQWTTWASMAVPRLYHSIAMLMPDGRVFVAGTGDLPGVPNELNAQIFSPPYLFKGPRPTITSSPSVVQYGSNFQVSTPDAASITSVSLIRTAAVTHFFDESTRRVSLPFTASNGVLNVQAPATSGDAPPGNYMLFIVNSNGVPSVASWVHLPAPYVEDSTPPAAPTGLTATATSSASVNLSWTASTDNVGVTGYNILRDGVQVGTSTTTSYTDNGVASNTAYTYTVTAYDAAGNVSTPSNSAPVTTPKEQCPCSIWHDGTPTGSFDPNDPDAQTTGVQFQASSDGFIDAVRFYKEPDDTGAHTGSLWSSTGTLLASGTFSGETASGWQELDFSSPVAVTAGTTYVASYFSSTGHPAATAQGLASAVTNGPLTALAGGGVYAYGSSNTFPTSTYNNNNYWVDVVYSPTAGATVPGAPSGVSATGGNGSAVVSWTAPDNGGSAITSYTVTPYIGSAAQTPVTVSGSPPATSTTVTGLTNGTSYTFTVSAANAVGSGQASSPSNSVTPSPPTVPGQPTGVSATGGNGSAVVSWTAPDNGGSAITSYTVTPYIGSAAQTPVTVSGSPPATSATVTGLTNGTSYTFTVSAANAVGIGQDSSPSNAVTPAVPPAVTGVTPGSGASGVAVSVAPSATFSQPVTPSTVSFTVKDSGGDSVAGTVGLNGGEHGGDVHAEQVRWRAVPRIRRRCRGRRMRRGRR